MTKTSLPRNKPAIPRSILAVRDLTRADLPKIREPREGVPATQRLRDPHHRVARLFAAGLRMQDIAERSGYSYNRIYSLSADPAFKELIAHYRGMVDAAYVESVDEYFIQATSNMRIAERMIGDKLEDADANNETLPMKDLLAISRDGADRFGYGKNRTNTNVNVDFASMLEKAITRSKTAKDITPSLPTAADVHPLQPLEQDLVEAPFDPDPAHLRRRA